MKKLLMLILLVVMAFSLTFMGISCKEEAVVEETEEAVEEEAVEEEAVEGDPILALGPVEIVVWNATHQPFQDEFVYLKEAFEAIYPNVTITEELVTWDTVRDRIAVGVSTNSTADAIWGSPFWLMGYARGGHLIGLNDIMGDDYDDQIAGAYAMVEVSGERYMYLNGGSADGFIVNGTWIDSLPSGDIVPKNVETSWTVDDFLTIAKEASDPANKKYGYGMSAGNEQSDQQHLLWLATFGAQLYNSDISEWTANGPEALEAMEFYLQLLEEELVPPNAATMLATELGPLVQGANVAMVYGNLGGMNLSQTAIDEQDLGYELRHVQFPSFPEIGPKSTIAPWGFAAFSTGDAAKEMVAAEYVKFICSPENTRHWYIGMGNGTVRKSMAAEVEVGSNAYISGFMAEYAIDFGVAGANYTQRREEFYQAMQAILTGNKTPQKGLDDLKIVMDALLAD